MISALEVLQVWRWLQWRLPPELWMEAMQILTPERPEPQSPELAQALADILEPTTLPAVRSQLLRDMLLTLRDSGLSPLGGAGSSRDKGIR